MRASQERRPIRARVRAGDGDVVRAARARRRRCAVAVATAAASILCLLGGAEARLSVIPGRTPGPRPTGTPQIVVSKAACQERIRSAAAELASGVRAALAACLDAGSPCVLEQAGSAACCAAAAPGCVREAEEIAAAEAAFVADVVALPCSGLAFEDLAGEQGLDFARTGDACLRLDPPVTVDGLGSLATCLERLVTEDVLHLLVTTEQPRALETLVCMDVEDRFPGVLRERPATCEELPVATPTPVPTATPAATPTAAQSPGGSPTPGGSPGAPTPTPGGATPTPQPTSGASCTQLDVTIAVDFNAGDFPDASGITVGLKYPAGLAIPGFGNQPTVLERVTNLTGVQGGLFSAGDQDDQSLLNIGLITTTSAIPPGSFARVRFDCAQGTAVPAPAAFTCTVDASTLAGNAVEPNQCVVTVAVP